MEFKIPEEIKKQKIEYLECLGDEVMDYLRANGFETLLDIIHRQDEIPQRLAIPIKGKMIFNVELPVEKETSEG